MKQQTPQTFSQLHRYLDQALRVENSFDMLARPLEIAGNRAMLYYINGFIRSEIMEEVISFLLRIQTVRKDHCHRIYPVPDQQY